MNIKDPINVSIISGIISLPLLICLLQYFQPNWIMVISRSGEPIVSRKRLISFSVTFSLVISITTLLVMSQYIDNKGEYNSRREGDDEYFVPTYNKNLQQNNLY